MSSQANEGWKTLRLALVLGALIGGSWLLFWRPAEKAGKVLNERVAQVLEMVTGEKTVIVEGEARVQEVGDVAELALVELTMSTVRTLENEKFAMDLIPLGKKRLQVRGKFLVKAGYDLAQGCELSLSEEGSVALAGFPDAKILSVELVDFSTLNEESGWFNALTTEDRDNIVSELQQQMRREAERSGLIELSENYLRTRLRDLLNVDEVSLGPFPRS